MSYSSAPTLSPVSVANQAASHLRAMILRGDLQPGSVVKDTVLAEEFGIARPTVRSAIQHLVAEGLLERQPGHSARVRQLSAEDIRDLYRVRRLIEGEALHLIMDRGQPLDGVEEALERFRAVRDEWEEAPDVDARFHTAVVDAAGSDRLRRMFTVLASDMRLLIAWLRPRYRSVGELYEEHRELVELLRQRNVDAVMATWSHHLDDAEQFLTRLALSHPSSATSPQEIPS